MAASASSLRMGRLRRLPPLGTVAVYAALIALAIVVVILLSVRQRTRAVQKVISKQGTGLPSSVRLAKFEGRPQGSPLP